MIATAKDELSQSKFILKVEMFTDKHISEGR